MAILDRSTSPDDPPQKSRLLSFLITGGALLIIVACCAGVGMIYSRWPTFNPDSQAAAAMTPELLDVTVPDVFAPQGTIDWDLGLLSMRGTYYTLTTGDGQLSLLEVDGRFIDNVDFRDHIVRSLREHGGSGELDLDVKSSETKPIDIGGQSVSFDYLFVTDRLSGTDRRLVDGIVDGKQGPVMISLWIADDHWDPALVQEMLQSIR